MNIDSILRLGLDDSTVNIDKSRETYNPTMNSINY